MFRIIKHADGIGVTVMALKTDQEVHFKEEDLLELQNEINLTYPPQGQSPVIQVVKQSLINIARSKAGAESKIEACKLLLDMERNELKV